VLGAALCVGACFHFTRPAALRAALERQVARVGVELASFDDISFSPWGGLRVSGLRFRVPSDSSTPGGGDRAVFSIGRARVKCRLTHLLIGRVTPELVEIQGADLSLFHAPGQDWSDGARSGAGSSWRLPELPPFVIRACDLRLNTFDPDGKSRLLRRWVVTGQGAPTVTADGKAGYRLTVDTTAGARVGPAGSPRPLLDAQLSERTAQLDTDWIDLDLAMLFLPPVWTHHLRQLSGAGHLRLEGATVSPEGRVDGMVRVAGLTGSVPVEDAAVAGADRYLQMRDASGFLRVQREATPDGGTGPIAVSGELAGRLNGAVATLVGSMSLGRGAGEAIVLDRYELAGHVDPISFPDAQRHVGFVRSARLPGPMRAFFKDYEPAGLFSLDYSVVMVERGAQPRIETVVEAHGARCRYRNFPYDIDQVYGRVRHSRGATLLEGLRGRHGRSVIRADGRIFGTQQWTGFDLSFRGENVPLDADLYAAIPSRERQLWEQARPIGLCDIAATVRRADGTAETGALPPDITVFTRILAGSLDLRTGERIEAADGMIFGRTEALTVDIGGHLGPATLSLRGSLVTGVEDSLPTTDFTLLLAGHELRHEQTVTGPGGDALGVIRADALADLWGRFEGESTGESRDGAYHVRVRDGQLSGFDPSWCWQGLNGWVTLLPHDEPEYELQAGGPMGQLALSARAAEDPQSDRPGNLQVTASGPAIERLLEQLIPPRWSNIRQALNLSGAGSVSGVFSPASAAGAVAEIHIQAAAMQPQPIPLPLREVSGGVLIHADGFELREATAVHSPDGGRISISGHGGWADQKPWTDLEVEADDLTVTPATAAALPAPVARLLEQLSLEGRIGLHLERLRFEGGEAREWLIKGRLDLDEARMQLGLPLTDFKAKLDGACRVLPDGRNEMAASFSIEGGKIAGRVVERMEGRIDQRLGDPRLNVTGITAALCGGSAVGSISIDRVTLEYDVQVDLLGIDLDRFLARPVAAGTSPESGSRLSGRVWARRRAGEKAPSGGGELRIVGGSLLATPVSASLADEARRSRPGGIGEVVSGADLYFVWQGDMIQFNRVEIRTPERWLRGAGAWNQRSDAVDLTLVAVPPDRAVNLGLLTELVHARELIQYRVSGTAQSPRVTAEPLYSISDAVRRMLEGN